MEQTGTTLATSKRTLYILLGVVAVLLVAIVAYLALGGGNGSPAGTAGTGTETGTDAGTSTGMPTMPGTTTDVPFDPATATKVPAGQSPGEYVAAYFDAVLAADYTTAYAMLPSAKQADYGSEQAFADQLTGYGITEYTIDETTENGDEVGVLATATMPGGAFQYLWTFVKDGDGWLVKSRTLPGMGG